MAYHISKVAQYTNKFIGIYYATNQRWKQNKQKPNYLNLKISTKKFQIFSSSTWCILYNMLLYYYVMVCIPMCGVYIQRYIKVYNVLVL